MNVLEIKGLSKIYRGKRGSRVHAITNLDLGIPSGEIFGFLGPNGAGKSTTIKSIMGQIRPSGGDIIVCGHAATDVAARLRIGYLPENPSFYDFMTAREYLHVVGKVYAMDDATINKSSEEVLRIMELEQAADRHIRGYSKGMVQRLGLAQALLHDPDLYILDEPMSGLDPLGRALVKDIMKSLKSRGKTIFFSTHITADIEAVCDRVGMIVKGNLMTVQRVQDLLQEGVEGYTVVVVRADGTKDEIIVDKEHLMSYIQDLSRSALVVERIEPRRKDLEAFFLEIVARGSHENPE